MPTLIELFNSRKYDTLANQTPKEAFAIRNSKTIPISSLSFALNKTATPAIIKLRNGNKTETLSETRIEQENVGLFQYMVIGSPAIYGTDFLRMSSQQSSLVETMKIATGGRGLGFTAAKIIGDTVGEAVKFAGSKAIGVPATFNAKPLAAKAVGSFKNTIGSLFPDVLIPSKVAASPLFRAKVPLVNEEYRTHTILATLKDISTGARVASFLARNATGTPDQIKQTLANQGLNIAQEQAKRFVAKKISGWLSQGGEKAQQLAREIRQTNNANPNYSSLRKYSETTKNEKDFGRNPLNFNNQPFTTNDTDIKTRKDLSTKLISEYVPDLEKAKQTKLKYLPELAQNKANYNQDFPIYSKLERTLDRVKFGLVNTDKQAKLKESDSVFGNARPFVSNEKSKALEQVYDTFDYVPLKFVSVANSSAVVFRGTITGLSEQFSPTWDSSRFIGSPFNFYTYQSIERSVQFTFKVASLSQHEHKINWEKLGFLSSLCYPQKYEATTGAVSAPFIRVTLGDMYRDKPCFVENMTYNIDDDTPWEVGLNGRDVQNYRLPMVIEITMTLKFVEAKSNTYNQVTDKDGKIDVTKIGDGLYGYKLSPDDIRIRVDKENQKKFESTNKGLSTPIPLKPEKTADDETKFDDDSKEAKQIQRRMKLSKTNIQIGTAQQGVFRYVYIQKKTGKEFYGDGTPINRNYEFEYIPDEETGYFFEVPTN